MGCVPTFEIFSENSIHPHKFEVSDMPKDLILNIYSGYREQLDFVKEPATASTQPAVDDVPQEAEQQAEGGAV